MPAATAEKPTDQMVVSKPATRTYLARREELRLIKKRDKPVFENGERVDFEPGERVAFTDGKLVIPLKGTFPGARQEPLNGPEIIEWIEGNPDKGKLPHPLLGNVEEGFWLFEQAPPPFTPAEQERLVELAEERDVAGLESFIAQEQAGWNRADLLEVAEGTLERVKARLADDKRSPTAA